MVTALAMVGCGSSSSSLSKNQTATPTFSPGAGTYTTSQTVTVSTATQGAVLYCTTDGTTPTTASPQCAEPTTVFQTEFLQAIAVAPGLSASAVASAAYTITLNAAATPTFSPAGGTYTSAQQVTINDATTGANIYYTTNGGTPSASSTLYTGPVTVSQSETLSAIAIASGYSNSAVASAAYTIQPQGSGPTITSLSPASATAGGAAFTLTVNGANFVSGTTVQWGSTGLTTAYVSATQVTAAVPASLIATTGSVSVTVTTPAGTSPGAVFTVSSGSLGAPTISSVSPSSATAGGAGFTLTINGTNFDSGTTVQWGATELARTYVSVTQLTAVVPASLIATPGSATVTVTSSAGTSPGSTFTVNAAVAVPTITSTSPASATAGGAAFTLTVNGANFVSGATVQWGNTALTTSFASATQLTASVPANLIASAGTASVTVTDSGGTSTGATFTINAAVPTISGISPTSVTAGGPEFTLTVNGTNFVSGATIEWGSTALTTTYGSATQLTGDVPASLIATSGSASVTVTEPAGTSAAATFTISAPNVPTISSLSPNTATAGGGTFTVTVNGTNFVSGATVQWGNTALTTTYGSATQLTAAVPASLIATAGTANVTVTEPAGTSSPATFAITALAPTITTISPASTAPGGALFTLTVNGTNFDSSAIVEWGNTALTTSFVNTTQLTAQVPASLIATAGSVDVTVMDTGGTSGAATFTIAPIVNGTVFSGALPISGATVQLYAAGITGYGAGSTVLATVPTVVTTDAGGNFSLQYACPASGAPSDQMYLIATGGNSGSGANSSIALMTTLGTCSKLPSSITVTVNEVTTVASAYALSAFATVNSSGGGITVGAPGGGSSCSAASNWQSSGPSTCNYIGLANAFATVSNLVSLSSGQALTQTPAYPANLANDPNIVNNSTVPQARINALADMLASCVESSGSACGSGLFSAATTTGGAAPVDTLQAALNIAQNPGSNGISVSTLLGLVPASNPPYATTLSATESTPPTDLTLALTFTGAGLGVAPGITLSDGNTAIVNSALGIDAAGNIWVAASRFNNNGSGYFSGDMLAGFNALGAPLTPATSLSSANPPVPTYGGYNPYPNHTSDAGMTMLAIDQSGDLWTDDGVPNVLELSYNPASNPSFSLLQTIPEISSASVTIDAASNAWFTENTTQLVELHNNGSAGASFTLSPSLLDLTFDSGGNLWGAGISGSGNGMDIYEFNASNGSIAYDASPSSMNFSETTLAVDSAGNIYGCDPAGANLDVFNANATTAPNLLMNSYPIATGRACGTQLVLDGQGHLFAVLNNGGAFPFSAFGALIDEFTTGGNLISPVANGYTGSSSAEAPTLNPDSTNTFSSLFTGTLAAIDGSGNLWVLNLDADGTNPSTFSAQPCNVLVEYVGIGAPVVTPASVALTNGVLGARP